MSFWYWSEVGSVIIALIAGLLFQQTVGWKFGMPFSAKDGLKFSFKVFAPAIWTILSLTLGVFYLSIHTSDRSPVFVCISIVCPSVIVLFATFSIVKNKISFNLEENAEQKNYELLDSWIKQFDFLDSRDVRKSTWTNDKGELIGNLFISAPKDKVCLLEEKRSELPSTLHVQFHAMENEEYEGLQKIRNWIKQFDFVEKAEDYTVFFKGSFSGEICFVTDSSRFDEIEMASSELPKGVHIKMASAKHLVHLISYASNELLEVQHPGEFRLVKVS